MEIDNIVEFKSSPEIKAKLSLYGIAKTFAEGDIILKKMPTSIQFQLS